eukprot:CAMPEP_0114278632 /NCGR_PEP_ID=MMETSP0059-20121206/1442_1 /TAXON_ID=36894 /ORGANISM="Pyramimonas parkeae, Strain CCMP726" /LENGTH=499 /DNA_ID=CAMNT_0001398847 /DNA_START=1 /DNA_END=1497 /DNA_ORIENTATION=-
MPRMHQENLRQPFDTSAGEVSKGPTMYPSRSPSGTQLAAVLRGSGDDIFSAIKETNRSENSGGPPSARSVEGPSFRTIGNSAICGTYIQAATPAMSLPPRNVLQHLPRSTSNHSLPGALDGVLRVRLQGKEDSNPASNFHAHHTHPAPSSSYITDGHATSLHDPSSFSSLPWDWSLKTQTKFHSDTSFEWTAKATRGAVRSAAIASVASAASPDESREEGLCRALLSYAHPAPHVSPPQGPRAQEDAHVHARVWQEAFESLYFMLRTNKCPMFYFVKPEPHPMVVLFLGPGVASRAGLSPKQGHAMVGRSSRGLRRVLRQAGVQFSTPLWSGSDDRVSEVDAEGDQIFDQLEKQHPSKVRRTHASEVVDGEPESLLEVHGASNVHALFNWLMIQTVSVDYGPPFTSQLPSLLAPLSFLHASLSMPQLTTSHAMLSESEGRVYKLELSGMVAPWTVQRVCTSLSATHASFQVSLQTHPLTSRLNVVATASPITGLGPVNW